MTDIRKFDKFILPSAEEMREFQCKRRLHIINQMKRNAEIGYVGLSIETELVPSAMIEELRNAGYEVSYYGEGSRKFTSIVWGEEEQNPYEDCNYRFKGKSCKECPLNCNHKEDR